MVKTVDKVFTIKLTMDNLEGLVQETKGGKQILKSF